MHALPTNNRYILKKMSVEELGVVVPKTDAALPLWTSMDNLWRRYMKDFSSLVASLMRLPRSLY